MEACNWQLVWVSWMLCSIPTQLQWQLHPPTAPRCPGRRLPQPPASRSLKKCFCPVNHIYSHFPAAPLCVTTLLLVQGRAGADVPGCLAQVPPSSRDDGSGFAAAALVSSRAGQNVSDKCFAQQKSAVLDRPELFIHSGFTAKRMDF